MASTRASIRYAKAILDIAHDKGVASEVSNDMASIASVIAGNAELNTFILSPTTNVEVKRSALLEVFGGIHDVTKSLFRLLFENKRFEILKDVATEYGRLFDEMNGIEKATVTTAVPMTPELEAKILTKILTFSNKKVLIENVVNPSIIGGFILKIGDKQYNASIASRLQVIKRELSN